MLEQLFTSSSSAGRKKKDDGSSELRRRSHTFTSSRCGSGNAPSSKRHKGRLSSAPASLRGSPANSGHHFIGESVKMSTSSELSTMEELQSAVQAAIAHCKSSAAASKQAAAGDDVRRKC
ncbi:hypothetical protein PR202_ga21252 [Eleusine coracana subsp. coracana]|uniref:BRI1 kinase inhibitor 1 n=1 Tax=Eleusine coracana subsp. coracana TaxID=191504 RepID=A0AAV5CZG8_ELECO|nr:hypothetical protein PR202_ga21252 [Eleusine coracana subsp. coracana]